MTVLLLGDSHLARLRSDLGPTQRTLELDNRAVGGADTRDLVEQIAPLDLSSYDVAVVSVGTNDAAPWKCVPVAEAVANLRSVCADLATAGLRLIFVAPPGVNESLLTREHDRTNEVIDRYREALNAVVEQAAGLVLDTPAMLAGVGPTAWIDDGVHLSAAGYEPLLTAVRTAIAHLHPAGPGCP